MGIPSYYKRLATSIKNIVVPHRKDGAFKAGALLFDFNCMIYQIIRDPKLRPFPGYADEYEAVQWEKEVCEKIVEYTLHVWREVGKPKTVFLGIDGVVPMAKIRQQRLRRFKSIWTAAEEQSRGLRPSDKIHWDTNAITPGTLFMERLAQRLEQLCKVQGWKLSDASETGEGEHKCMDFWRSGHITEGPIVIYGLDADLILLSLLTGQLAGSKYPVYLFREITEWEGGKDGVSEFMRFSVDELSACLLKNRIEGTLSETEWFIDYIAGMSLLGNDFVPHSLSFKIREKGHEILLRLLSKLHVSGGRLVTVDRVYNKAGLLFILKDLAVNEETAILSAIKHKGQRINYEDWNMRPCEWRVEEKLLCAERGILFNNWEDYFYKGWFGSGVSKYPVASEYLSGLQWILDYYTGQKVNRTWFYPWGLPPTWKTLLHYLNESELPAKMANTSQDIQPQEQLAMVLPLESWNFIRDPALRTLPQKLPHYWPKSYGFFSAGKTFMWECEPEIPILTISRIRASL
jgi:5'-3' exonuclease